jgi:uncharacterized phiE125 gp8 family phage protein
MLRSPWWSLSLVMVGEPPLTREEAKAQCRIAPDVTDDDELIEGFCSVAADVVERMSGQALLQQTWRRTATDFPDDDEPIVLPRPPLSAVGYVKYLDPSGVLQTWDPSKYRVITIGQFGAIVPVVGTCYPRTLNARCGRHDPDALQIEFTCGYDSAEAIPRKLMLAQQLLVAHWYAEREIDDGEGLGLSQLIGVPARVDPCW